MPLDDATDALLRLVMCAGATAPRRRLLAMAGNDPRAALAAGHAAWREAGLDGTQIAALRARDGESAARLDAARAWLEAPGRHLVGAHDADFPPLLARMPSPPLALFVAGEPGLLWHPQIAIVGSRSASAGGLDNASHFARELAGAGLAITSGLAAGIDHAAHEAALAAGGATIAVLGCGPDIAYPARHAALLARIATEGAVASEYPPGTPPLRSHFPARNRIVAGLSAATLVIEAAERSGALITARLAADAGREVLALPGSLQNPASRGCHQLLRDGATLATCPGDVLETLAPMLGVLGEALSRRLGAPNSGACEAPGPRDPDHQKLWRALGHDPIPMDTLLSRTGLTVAELSTMLLALELEGHVAVEHGRYTRKSAALR